MKTFEMFMTSNEKFSSMFDEALRSFESEVVSHPKHRWRAINYSVSALYEVLSPSVSKEEIPFLIEALCNLHPRILNRNYYFIDSDNDDPFIIAEADVMEADAKDCFYNPYTGEPDPWFRSKIVLRYSLSDEVIENE